ncbi:unnamed protein product [Vitrella brassicaformis CCMP3155]|uniref:Uncharacterized protein n=2 Tax=Vitrella brassicaformis TaxID=1169539 RepID=A0A0G4EFL5_VITBC|nr:unnamed protein product [Vitrella brassicaformis CCMP3155]|eukprot:CEL94930.1 unnamed protein product [Vitrella brassicaformis CCMP3155]
MQPSSGALKRGSGGDDGGMNQPLSRPAARSGPRATFAAPVIDSGLSQDSLDSRHSEPGESPTNQQRLRSQLDKAAELGLSLLSEKESLQARVVELETALRKASVRGSEGHNVSFSPQCLQQLRSGSSLLSSEDSHASERPASAPCRSSVSRRGVSGSLVPSSPQQLPSRHSQHRQTISGLPSLLRTAGDACSDDSSSDTSPAMRSVRSSIRMRRLPTWKEAMIDEMQEEIQELQVTKNEADELKQKVAELQRQKSALARDLEARETELHDSRTALEDAQQNDKKRQKEMMVLRASLRVKRGRTSEEESVLEQQAANACEMDSLRREKEQLEEDNQRLAHQLTVMQQARGAHRRSSTVANSADSYRPLCLAAKYANRWLRNSQRRRHAEAFDASTQMDADWGESASPLASTQHVSLFEELMVPGGPSAGPDTVMTSTFHAAKVEQDVQTLLDGEGITSMEEALSLLSSQLETEMVDRAQSERENEELLGLYGRHLGLTRQQLEALQQRVRDTLLLHRDEGGTASRVSASLVECRGHTDAIKEAENDSSTAIKAMQRDYDVLRRCLRRSHDEQARLRRDLDHATEHRQLLADKVARMESRIREYLGIITEMERKADRAEETAAGKGRELASLQERHEKLTSLSQHQSLELMFTRDNLTKAQGIIAHQANFVRRGLRHTPAEVQNDIIRRQMMRQQAKDGLKGDKLNRQWDDRVAAAVGKRKGPEEAND